ncbi:hypothetical protein [Pseudoalteromonas galatheae]|uniref:hypothetical protein n=1 Tax=Pseudoalteromonas galatheae TaxID=579562 RepID=UPI0030D5A3D6
MQKLSKSDEQVLFGSATFSIPMNKGDSKLLELEKKTTDELLDMWPSPHLHIVKNPKANDSDKWRVFNMVSQTYVEPGYSTARELLIHILPEVLISE